MNEIDQRLKDLSDIRSMMERSSKFLSLSGLAGVSVGIIALMGAAAAYRRLSINKTLAEPENVLTFFILDAVAVLLLAVGFAIFFTTRMARKKGLPVWSNTTKYLLTSLVIPLATGGVFCLILWYHGLVLLIPAATLMFYGLALLNSSKHTLEEIRYLAAAEILLGLATALLLDHWLIFWSIGFGALHIVYGIFMYLKYEK